LVPRNEILQLDTEFTTFTHHSGPVSVRNRRCGVCALRNYNRLAHLEIAAEQEFYRVTLG
jgi:hypothetical protein